MVMTRKLAVLDAPCNLGLRPAEADAVPCAQKTAYALRQRELVERLGARDAGQIEPPADADEADRAKRSPCFGTSMRAFMEGLAARTRELVAAREFPVVLGGECSVLVGTLLGLRSLGRFGLLFVDGHDESCCARELGPHRSLLTAAGLDLAIATGNGPDAMANLHGLRPYVEERHVVLFGLLERVRALGARAAAEEAVRYLEALPIDGFWIHVDADVFDRDMDEPGGGCPYQELTEALRVFVASEKAVGLELTFFDPELDPDGVHGEKLVDAVVDAFCPDA
jgi:arginase